MRKRFTITLLSMTIMGCTSSMNYSMCSTGNVDTELESYKAEKQYKKVLVDSPPAFSKVMCAEFKKKGIQCKGFNEVFSPLKTYSPETRQNTLEKEMFDALLMVDSGGNAINSWNAGSITNISAVQTGNTVNGFAMSTSMTGLSRATTAQIVIYDIPSFEKMYLVNTVTTGMGAACVGDEVFFRSLSESVVKDLLK